MSSDAVVARNFEVERTSRLVRSLLFLGFGGLLAIMLAAGFAALRTLGELHAAEESARRDYLARNQALSTVNVSIHLYGDRFEQLLLSTTSGPDDPMVSEHLAGVFAEARNALGQYPATGNPAEQQLLALMDRQLVEQERVMRTMLGWGANEKRRLGPSVLNRQLIPSRLQLLDASQQIASMNRARLSAADAQLFERFADLRKQLTWMIVLGLGAGLMLSILCAVYILRLERQAHERYQLIARSQRDLEQLSARLVDAQEEERRSLSRELHDEVGQSLSALLVDVARLKNQIPEDNTVIHEELRHIRSVAESTVNSVRNMALLLRPSMLDDLGLVAALEWQGREVSRQGQMEVSVRADGVPEDIGDDLKICIYRVVQEALNNAARHASARNARVNVSGNDKSIRVSVTDDGRGFDATRVRGLGLLGMEERIRRLGGTFTIDSQPGQGTTVVAELPLPGRDQRTFHEEAPSIAG